MRVLPLGRRSARPFFDFPRSEVLFLLFYRAAGLVTDNVALIHNVFYFAGFPLVAWSALAVLRRELHVAWPLAVAGAIVFCWLPYHFLRLEHLHLSNYVAVPIAAWLMLRVGGERPPFFERGRLGAATPAVWLAVALVAVTSIYYAFFAVVLIAGVGRDPGGRLAVVATRAERAAGGCVHRHGARDCAHPGDALPGRGRGEPAGRGPVRRGEAISTRYARFTCCCHPPATRRHALASFARTYNASTSYTTRISSRRSD